MRIGRANNRNVGRVSVVNAMETRKRFEFLSNRSLMIDDSASRKR